MPKTLVIIGAFVALIACIAYYVIHHNKNSKNEEVCYHTHLDCENCIFCGECRQKEGQGLIHTTGGE